MHDIIPHGKALFWAFLIAVIALAGVPSVVLMETAGQYYRFLSGWDPGVLQTHRLRVIPHPLHPPQAAFPNIHFVEFRLKAPKAKAVRLAGDFNHWRPDLLPMTKSRGQWEIQIPLPPGTYQYLFQVDGAWTQDPASKNGGQWDGLRTSVREVQ